MQLTLFKDAPPVGNRRTNTGGTPDMAAKSRACNPGQLKAGSTPAASVKLATVETVLKLYTVGGAELYALCDRARAGEMKLLSMQRGKTNGEWIVTASIPQKALI